MAWVNLNKDAATEDLFETLLRRMGDVSRRFVDAIGPNDRTPVITDTRLSREVMPRMHALDLDLEQSIYVVASDSPFMQTVLGWLVWQGGETVTCRSVSPRDRLWYAPEGSYALIDVDALGGIVEACDDILRLRKHRPDIMIILLSHDFLRHEFGKERLPLADACLRLPCSFANLELAMVEAELNNQAWQLRVEDLGADA